MKRISFIKILRISVFIFSLINLSTITLRSYEKGGGDKSVLVPNEMVQNQAIQENDNSSLNKGGIFKKNVRLYSVVLIVFLKPYLTARNNFQNYLNYSSSYFISYPSITAYPIPPPSIS